jgi:hypothetical protein
MPPIGKADLPQNSDLRLEDSQLPASHEYRFTEILSAPPGCPAAGQGAEKIF